MPQKLACKVLEVLDHGEQVYSLFLKPAAPAPRFQPGQFLHLALDSYSPGDFWPDSRPFSIASSPLERSLLRITYAVKGQFTRRMEAELQPGRTVWIKLPYGEFTIDARADVCLVAGGTGITAFSAFLSALAPAPAGTGCAVHLFYGARQPDLLIYRPLIESARQRCPNLHAHYWVEEQPGPSGLPDPAYSSGQIDLAALWESVPAPLQKLFYLAGPPAMLQAFSAGLQERGVPAGRIFVDDWS